MHRNSTTGLIVHSRSGFAGAAVDHLTTAQLRERLQTNQPAEKPLGPPPSLINACRNGAKRTSDDGPLAGLPTLAEVLQAGPGNTVIAEREALGLPRGLMAPTVNQATLAVRGLSPGPLGRRGLINHHRPVKALRDGPAHMNNMMARGAR